MRFKSTHDDSTSTSFYDAVFQGLAPDGGLYIPTEFPHLSNEAINHSASDSLTQLAMRIMSEFITEIPIEPLQHIIDNALTFPMPLIFLENNLYLLELFHGPTLAFKDIGARFMANTLSYFLTNENKHLSIIVATSGDTGSAIANAFYQIPHIDVFILYPSGKITSLQEKQITAYGGNVHALEVIGTFDDCQNLVKTALTDKEVRNKNLLTTANSINIGRLLPQIIYHSFGLCQLRQQNVTTVPVLSVPSGNFGNLTSAIYTKKLGFPIQHFIAATNLNASIPTYLKTGHFEPKPSVHTYSSAMDVGNPSNFERLAAAYDNNEQAMRNDIDGISVSNEATLETIRRTYETTGYILDPHTAVGVAAAKQWRSTTSTPIIITATAHPAKFPEVIQRAIGIEPEIPERLKAIIDAPKQALSLPVSTEAFKNILMQF